MDSVKKANLLVILIIAILGFGMSNILATFTGEYINLGITEFTTDNQKLIAVNDGNFTPAHINTVEIVNDTNNTDNTTEEILNPLNNYNNNNNVNP